MNQGSVLFIDTVHPALEEALVAQGWICTDGSGWNEQETLRHLAPFTGVVIRSRFRIDRNFLDHAPALRFIARAGAGMENIDTDAAQVKGVICLNAPEGNRNAVAEHALGMLLALMNKLVTADHEVRKGVWKREENRGTEIDGKSIGIIGYGNTGSAFAGKLSGFEAEILVCDPYITIKSPVNPRVRQVQMQTIFEQCDIVSLHVPLTHETSHLVNDRFIAHFKKPFFLLNTSRGRVVDTAAVVAGLESGSIRGAALDVLEFESLSFEKLQQHELPEAFLKMTAMQNVVLSPHIAGWTVESHRKISEVLARKIVALT
jgi:D-3-phosphoglycerate dehydrogenase